MTPMTFSLEKAPEWMRTSFSHVQSADMRSRITVTDAALVIDYLRSMRSFIAVSDSEFGETLNTARMLVEGQIAERGSFVINTHMGFVVARQPRSD